VRVALSAAVAAAFALIALPAAAHGWGEDRGETVNECPLPAYHHHASHMMLMHRHHAVRCEAAAVYPPVEEHVVRIYHHEDMDGWRGEHGDRDEAWREREEHWRDRDRDQDWRGADGDRRMFEDHGRGYVDGAVYREREEHEGYGDHGRAYVDGAVHHEDEDRRGWNDREYAYRDGGMHWDSGEARWRVYQEQRERSWAHGEHWIEHCGCGPARPTATDEYGYLVWAGKVAPPGGPDEPTWYVRP